MVDGVDVTLGQSQLSTLTCSEDKIFLFKSTYKMELHPFYEGVTSEWTVIRTLEEVGKTLEI